MKNIKTLVVLLLLLSSLPNGKAKDNPNPPDACIRSVIEKIKKNNIHFLQLLFTDIFGNPKLCTISSQITKSTLRDGASFDGSSIPGYSSITKSDLLLKPDLNTFKILPWTNDDNKTAVVICDVCFSDGTPHPNCTRNLLKQAAKEATELGYSFNTSPELEFYIYKKRKQPLKKHLTKPEYIKLLDEKGYCEEAEEDPTYQMKQEIIKTLEELNIKPEKFHHEVASSQHEITIKYGKALETADRIIITKKAIKQIANKHGLNVTFMPKPLFGENGSGMHINYSLFDIKTNKNAFFDSEKEFFFSDLARHFIAGNLKHVKDFTAILNPSINSYKRLVKGYEAPIFVCWGQKNRSVLIRVPENNQNNSNTTRAEMRSPDPMCNPYLSFAVILKSGLAGVINQEEVASHVFDNLFALSDDKIKAKDIAALPHSLGKALKLMKQSEFMKNVLGEELLNEYVIQKEKEVFSYNTSVTNWELQHYL